MAEDLKPLDLVILQTLDDAGHDLSYHELEERCAVQDGTNPQAVFDAVYRLASHPDVPFVDIANGRIRLLSLGQDLLRQLR